MSDIKYYRKNTKGVDLETQLFEQVVRANALSTLYRLGVEPKDYEKFWNKEFSRQYAIAAMQDAGNPLKDELEEVFSEAVDERC